MKLKCVQKTALTGIAKAHVVHEMEGKLVYLKTATNWGCEVDSETAALMLNAETSLFHDNAQEYAADALNGCHGLGFSLSRGAAQLVYGLPVITLKGRSNTIHDYWEPSATKMQWLEGDKKIYEATRLAERFLSGSVGDSVLTLANWAAGVDNDAFDADHYMNIVEDQRKRGDAVRCARLYNYDTETVHAVYSFSSNSGTNDNRLVCIVMDVVDTGEFQVKFTGSDNKTAAEVVFSTTIECEGTTVLWSAGGASVVPQGLHVYWFEFDVSSDTYSIWVDGKLCYIGAGTTVALHDTTTSDIQDVEFITEAIVDETFQAYTDGEDIDGDSKEYIAWETVLEAGWASPGVCAVTQATLGGVASKWLRMYKTSAMDKYMRVWGQFDTASPNTPGASPNDYKVYCDIYIHDTRGFIELTESNALVYLPTRRVGVYFKNDGTITSDIGGGSGTNIKWGGVNGTWVVDTLYHVVIWITAAGTYKVSLNGGSTWSDSVTNAGGNWGATMKTIWFLGSGSWQHDFYVDNIDVSWTKTPVATEVDALVYSIDASWPTVSVFLDLSAYNEVYKGCLDDEGYYHHCTAAAADSVAIIARRVNTSNANDLNITHASLFSDNTQRIAFERLAFFTDGEIGYLRPATSFVFLPVICNDYNEKEADATISASYSDGTLYCSWDGFIVYSKEKGAWRGSYYFSKMDDEGLFAGQKGALVNQDNTCWRTLHLVDFNGEVIKSLDNPADAKFSVKSEDDFEVAFVEYINDETWKGTWFDPDKFAGGEDITDWTRITDTGTAVLVEKDTDDVNKGEIVNTSDPLFLFGMLRKSGSVTIYITPRTVTTSLEIFLQEDANERIKLKVKNDLSIDYYTGGAYTASGKSLTADAENYIMVTWLYDNTFTISVNGGAATAALNQNSNWTNGCNKMKALSTSATAGLGKINTSWYTSKVFRVFGGIVESSTLDAEGDWLVLDCVGHENEWFTRPSSRPYNFIIRVLLWDFIKYNGYPLCEYQSGSTGVTTFNGDLYDKTPAALLDRYADIEGLVFFIAHDSWVTLLPASPWVGGGGHCAVMNSGRKRMPFNEIQVIGSNTTTGQISSTRTATTSTTPGKKSVYVPESRTVAQCAAIGDSILARRNNPSASIVMKRQEDEYIGRKINITSEPHGYDNKSLHVVEEQDDGEGGVTLTLVETLTHELGGILAEDHSGRGNVYAQMDPTKAAPGGDGSRSGVTNQNDAVQNGFMNIYSGTTAPEAVVGRLWIDTTAGYVLKAYIGGSWRSL